MLDRGRENRTMGEDLERLKQRLPLLEYLQRHNWNAHRAGVAQEFVGLCPLHPETRPSFYVNARKNLFYCHGCGRGGDLIRFIELFRNLSFRQSIALLRQELIPDTDSQLLEQAHAFYQLQLHRYPEAVRYLEQRGLRDPGCIEELGIGYAPGGRAFRPGLPVASRFSQHHERYRHQPDATSVPSAMRTAGSPGLHRL